MPGLGSAEGLLNVAVSQLASAHHNYEPGGTNDVGIFNGVTKGMSGS